MKNSFCNQMNKQDFEDHLNNKDEWTFRVSALLETAAFIAKENGHHLGETNTGHIGFFPNVILENNKNKDQRYFVSGDHPVLARPDKVVSELELEQYKHELKLAGFENITARKI
jgi:hypothetical protein